MGTIPKLNKNIKSKRIKRIKAMNNAGSKEARHNHDADPIVNQFGDNLSEPEKKKVDQII